jgi:hypothetical protein
MGDDDIVFLRDKETRFVIGCANRVFHFFAVHP